MCASFLTHFSRLRSFLQMQTQLYLALYLDLLKSAYLLWRHVRQFLAAFSRSASSLTSLLAYMYCPSLAASSLTSADVCWRNVCWRLLSYDVC
jgi:hypothetical protein